jgi:hypothetical protein
VDLLFASQFFWPLGDTIQFDGVNLCTTSVNLEAKEVDMVLFKDTLGYLEEVRVLFQEVQEHMDDLLV